MKKTSTQFQWVNTVHTDLSSSQVFIDWLRFGWLRPSLVGLGSKWWILYQFAPCAPFHFRPTPYISGDDERSIKQQHKCMDTFQGLSCPVSITSVTKVSHMTILNLVWWRSSLLSSGRRYKDRLQERGIVVCWLLRADFFSAFHAVIPHWEPEMTMAEELDHANHQMIKIGGFVYFLVSESVVKHLSAHLWEWEQGTVENWEH